MLNHTDTDGSIVHFEPILHLYSWQDKEQLSKRNFGQVEGEVFRAGFCTKHILFCDVFVQFFFGEVCLHQQSQHGARSVPG